MTILITGATGNVSSALLRSLDSQPVRALVRDPAKAPPGTPFAVGDLDQPASLLPGLPADAHGALPWVRPPRSRAWTCCGC